MKANEMLVHTHTRTARSGVRSVTSLRHYAQKQTVLERHSSRLTRTERAVGVVVTAAAASNTAVVDTLIQWKADVNIKRCDAGQEDKDGRTPLMVAAQFGFWKSAEKMIEDIRKF